MNIGGREMVWSDDHMAWIPAPVKESEFGWKPLVLWFVLVFALLVAAVASVVYLL